MQEYAAPASWAALVPAHTCSLSCSIHVIEVQSFVVQQLSVQDQAVATLCQNCQLARHDTSIGGSQPTADLLGFTSNSEFNEGL